LPDKKYPEPFFFEPRSTARTVIFFLSARTADL
jgi:hypothetical protein